MPRFLRVGLTVLVHGRDGVVDEQRGGRVKGSGRGPPQGRQSNDEGFVVDVSTLHVIKSTTLGSVCLSYLLARVGDLWPQPLEGGRRKGGNQMSKDLCSDVSKTN